MLIHYTLRCPSKILHKHCFQFLLGRLKPQERLKQSICKFWRDNQIIMVFLEKAYWNTHLKFRVTQGFHNVHIYLLIIAETFLRYFQRSSHNKIQTTFLSKQNGRNHHNYISPREPCLINVVWFLPLFLYSQTSIYYTVGIWFELISLQPFSIICTRSRIGTVARDWHVSSTKRLAERRQGAKSQSFRSLFINSN